MRVTPALDRLMRKANMTCSVFGGQGKCPLQKGFREVATPGGFEPPISTVTGWHVSPLHHGAVWFRKILAGCKAGSSLLQPESIRGDMRCQDNAISGHTTC